LSPCLASALFRTWDFEGAEKEYRKAIELDPSEPGPHLGLGGIREEQKKYDAALEEYRVAENLDNDSAEAHRDAGRVLLARTTCQNALHELKYAVNLNPSYWTTHKVYAEALDASGDHAAAIAEFKQALAIEPKEISIRFELGEPTRKAGTGRNPLSNFVRRQLWPASTQTLRTDIRRLKIG